MLLAATGIGLVIFVHELGHFLAARWCGVRVEVFSLGFGPPLLSFRRRGTRYQLALVPLGGYVRMAGEEGRPEGGSRANDELWSKSVGQRFLIYSGGVLMNLAFGLLVFPLLFARGVPFTEPLIGEPIPGGPAWHARLPEGTRVLAVNGQPVFEFGHIPTQVALGDPGHTRLTVAPPGGGEARELALTPRLDETHRLYTIDVLPAVSASAGIEVEPGSAAAAAGLANGDRLLAVEGAPPELTVWNQLSYATRLGGAVALELESAAGARKHVELEPQQIPGASARRLGISPPRNRVQALRASPALDALGLRVDDRLLEVNGHSIRRLFDLHDALLQAEGPLQFAVERGARRMELAAPPLPRAQRFALCEDIALHADEASTELVVVAGEAADKAGLLDGDRVLSIDDMPVAGWTELQERVRAAGKDGRALTVKVERPVAGEAPSVFQVEVSPSEAPALSYGFAPRTARYVYRAGSPTEALRAGWLCSWRFVEDLWLTVKRMLMGQVGSQNLGGIITISRASYWWAEEGLAKLLFFLAMLSINLAFLNVLPVPLLDGGHLLFLLIERIKGTPVSERVYSFSQMVGLVLLLSLMVYVTYNDLMRLFTS